MTDQELVLRAKQGDQAAFEQLVVDKNRLIVPQNTSSPTPLSTGRDSPVIMD